MKKEEIKKLLLDWRGRITPAAEDLVEQLFASADRVLLEYADKAENNAVQAKFFEGQRELWLKKNQIISLFHDNLTRDLFQFMSPAQRAATPGAEVLSLVSKDTFERSLALETISDQALKKNQELYYGLSQRLGVVTGGPAIPYEELPAGPYQLAGVFEHAAQVLTVERQVLLALYTLFEHEVIRESPPWHEELNEALREGGILPNLKYEVKIQPGEARPDEAKPKSDVQPPGYGGNYAPATGAAGHGGHIGSGGQGPADRGYGSYGASAGPGAAATGNTSYGQRSASGTALPEYSGYSDSGGSGTDAQGHGGDSGSPESGADPYTNDGTKQLGDQLLGRIQELLSARRSRMASAQGLAVRPDPARPAPASEVATVIGSPQVQGAVPLPETGVREAGVRQVLVTRALLEKLRVALAAQRSQIKETVGEDKLSHFDEDTIDIVGMLFEVMLNDGRLANTVKALLSHLHTPYLKLAVRDRGFLKRREHPARRLFDNMIEAGSRWVDENDLTQGVYPKLQRIVDLILKAKDHSPQLLEELDEGLSADIKLRSERQQAREVRTLETEKGKARLEEAREAATRTAHTYVAAGGAPAQYQEFISGPWTDYLTLLYLRSNGDTNTPHWKSALDLSRRLRICVDGLAANIMPGDGDLKALHDELGQRLGDAIPHYETKVRQLFELFSADHEVTIVAPTTALPPSAPSPTVNLAATGKALLERLPKLPPGSWVVFHNKDAADQVVKLSWFNPKTDRFLFVDQAGVKALVVPLQKLADQIDRERAHVLLATGASYVESSLERALNTLEKR